MNGRPSRSSLKPGPSPTNTTSVSGSPSPGTARVRVSCRRQFVQTRTSAAIASSADWRSASVTPWPRRRSAARVRPGAAGWRAGDPAPLAEDLGQLDRVRRGALAQVVARRPRRRGPGRRRSIRPGGPGRRRSRRARRPRSRAGSVLGRVVLDDDAGHGGEQLARALRRDRVARLDVDRLGVARRRPGTRTAVQRDPQVRQAQDLAVLGDDLPLLLGVAVGQEDVDLGQRVERDRMRVDGGDRRLAGDVGPDLALELGDARRRRCPTRTGRCRRRPVPGRPRRAAPSAPARAASSSSSGWR